jgi:hypothetical protein
LKAVRNNPCRTRNPNKEAPMTTSPPLADVSPADRIAQRAYERFEARGRQDGHDREDWFEAERELQQGVSPDSTTGRGEDVKSDEAA